MAVSSSPTPERPTSDTSGWETPTPETTASQPPASDTSGGETSTSEKLASETAAPETPTPETPTPEEAADETGAPLSPAEAPLSPSDPPLSDSVRPHTPARPASRHLSVKSVLLGLLIGLFAVALVIGVDMALQSNRIPRGVTVAGTTIGGMTRTAAEEELQKTLDGVELRPVEVRAGDLSANFVPRELGLRVDYAETLNAAGKPSWNPIAWVQSFRDQRTVKVVSGVDKEKLSEGVNTLLKNLNRTPENGDVSFDAAGQIAVRDAVTGQEVDPEELKQTLRTYWTTPEKLEAPVEVQEPDIAQEDVDKAIGVAHTILKEPITARGLEGVTATIQPAQLKDVVAFVPEKGVLEPKLNMEQVGVILGQTLASTETRRRNATVVMNGSQREITPSVDGFVIDWEETLRDFDLRILGDDPRTFDVVYKEEPATFTTEQAERADFSTVIGTFTTSGFSGASGKNIELVAQTVNGAVVAPGEVFSLNGYTGPRGSAQGYVESGIIIDGHSGQAVGGGISQFATTLYNAAYFAGMEDVEHKAHSYYISRYPAGREATVYEGAIDLKFKNTSPYPVLITANKTASDITVSLNGVKTVNVESVNGGRWAETTPESITLTGDDCSPSSGSNGFTTSDTRIVSDLDGNELSRTTTTTVYDPSPKVTCK